jgi:uncharacterized YigZ family protein
MLIPTKKSKEKYIEKKSSFIAYVYPIKQEKEVPEIINKIKKKHKSAAHIPYAYRLVKFIDGKKRVFERYNDDGEPSRTAGYPVLRIMHTQDLSNILVIIVRMFGGIKLGMAGLMKAFKTSAKEAIDKSKLIEKELKEEIIIETNLSEYHDIEVILKKYRIEFEHEFTQRRVLIKCYIPINDKEQKKKLNSVIQRINS